MKTELQTSGLLLISRVLSIGLNLAAQILTIGYLTQHDYGVLAIVLLVFGSAAALPVLGLDKALTRVLPGLVVARNGQALHSTLRFAVVTVAGFMALLSLIGVGVIGALEWNPTEFTAIVVLFVLLPLGACDRVLEGILAALRRADEIARRKYLYRPVMRIVLISGAIAMDGGLPLIAAAHSLTMAVGLLFYVTAVLRALRANQLDGPPGDGEAARQALIDYAKPQYGSDLTALAQAITIPALVTALAGSVSMATYAAVLPFARLNQLVIEAIAPVYTPGAARLIAQNRAPEVAEFFWRTASLVVALTFPMLAMTTVFGEVLLMTFLDERYRTAAVLLTICSIGCFCQVAFGFTSFQLRLENHGDKVFRADVWLALLEAGLAVVLIRQWGALGAALALSIALSTHGLTKRYLLQRYSAHIHVRGFRTALYRVYLPLGLLLAGLAAVAQLIQLNLLAALTLTTLAWLVLLRWARPELRMGRYFPFLTRLPGVRWFV